MRYQHIKKSDAETHTQDSGEINVFLATGADTDGRVSIYDSFLPEGRGAPWHFHEIDDEIFYIISGEVEFDVAEDTFTAKPGDLVIAGPNVPRRFTALADSKLLVVNAPGGPSEGFLRDVMSLDEPPTESDVKRFAEDYKIHIV